MNKYFIFSCLLATLLFVRCAKEELEGVDTPRIEAGNSEYQEGVIVIKLKPEPGENISVLKTRSGDISTGIASLDELALRYNATDIKRVFRDGGKFEPRMRKEGLHLWYVMRYDEDVPVSRAMESFAGLPEIDIVQPAPVIHKVPAEKVEEMSQYAMDYARRLSTRAATPYNDPMLAKQWHYSNDGSIEAARGGADINLFRAWEITTGSPDVIVSIHDTGIDRTHEDLAANMWKNEAEANGSAGVDDDDNGYVDDVYGWNFVDDSPYTERGDHGTHVAGTVAAVNNNGIGGGGIAGGDGTPGTGVRLMNCQIFYGSISLTDGTGTAESFVYAANNGAVISQNSWSGTQNELYQEAINYFTTYAGIDEYGNQVGPMKGGLVLFAAGNDNSESPRYPGAFDNAYAVTSFGPSFEKASYSNYGTWTSFAAPGGNTSLFGTDGAVWSTLPDNSYGAMQGTSMACPHMSGVAALVVSKFGGIGFTVADLVERLELGLRDIDVYNPDYKGKLGTGYIDARKALTGGVVFTPNPATDLSVDWGYEKLEATFKVPAAGANGKPVRIEAVATSRSFSDISPLANGLQRVSVDVSDKAEGETVTATVSGLKDRTDYNVAICVFDIDNNMSVPTTATGYVDANVAPVVTGVPENPSFARFLQTEYTMPVTDEEGDDWDFEVVSKEFHDAVKLRRSGDNLVLVVNAGLAAVGQNYRFVFKVEDVTGSSRTYTINYNVVTNNPTQLTGKEFADVLLTAEGEQQTFDLTEYFFDADGDALTYEFVVDPKEFIGYSVENDILTLTAKEEGTAEATLRAWDPSRQATSPLNFSITTLFGENPGPDPEPGPGPSGDVTVYPTVVESELFIRTENAAMVNVRVYNSRGSEVITTSLQCSEQNPGRLDVSRLSGGSYSLTLNYGGVDHKRSFTKK